MKQQLTTDGIASTMKAISFNDLANTQSFDLLCELTAKQSFIYFFARLKDGKLSFDFGAHDKSHSLLINSPLMVDLRNYLNHGYQLPSTSSLTPMDKATERTLLHIINLAKLDCVLHFKPRETGAAYRGKFRYGVIDFGELPYSKEQLTELLNTL